jgi:hypothetical protein
MAVLFYLSCSVPTVLSFLSSPGCPALVVLSCSSVLAALFCRSCSADLVMPVQFCFSYSICPFFESISTYPEILPVLFCLSCSAVLFWLFFSGCPLHSVLAAALFWQPCPGRPVWRSCHGSFVLF